MSSFPMGEHFVAACSKGYLQTCLGLLPLVGKRLTANALSVRTERLNAKFKERRAAIANSLQQREPVDILGYLKALDAAWLCEFRDEKQSRKST